MAVPFVRDNKTTLKVAINAPQDVVWDLLATPEGLSRWLPVACAGNIGPSGQFEMAWADDPGPQDLSTHRVTIWEPRRRFAFTWPGVQLNFEIARQDIMTVVRLSCTYNAREAGSDQQLEELVGWTMHLLTLKSVAENGVDLRTPDRAFSWEKGFITGI
jgi:uncharacterized protein YndB with AHSA1/START domain